MKGKLKGIKGKLRGRPWKPGESGNPSGKSKTRAEYQRQFEEISNKLMLRDGLVSSETYGKMRPCFEVLIKHLLQLAASGKAWAMQEALFRFLGRDFNLSISAADEIKNQRVRFIVEVVKPEDKRDGDD